MRTWFSEFCPAARELGSRIIASLERHSETVEQQRQGSAPPGQVGRPHSQLPAQEEVRLACTTSSPSATVSGSTTLLSYLLADRPTIAILEELSSSQNSSDLPSSWGLAIDKLYYEVGGLMQLPKPLLCGDTEGRPRIAGLCGGPGDVWAAGEGEQAGRQQDEGGGQHGQAEHAGLV